VSDEIIGIKFTFSDGVIVEGITTDFQMHDGYWLVTDVSNAHYRFAKGEIKEGPVDDTYACDISVRREVSMTTDGKVEMTATVSPDE
jgi:hypothetical protein